MISILFVCLAVPLIMLIFLLERRSARIVTFVLIGCLVCLLAAQINYLIWSIFPEMDAFRFKTTVAPAVEEVLKAIPILIFAFGISDNKTTVLEISMATGIGFAILETLFVMSTTTPNVSLFWALLRGIGAGLMHGVCTFGVGLGITFIRKKRKLFITGTFALLMTAIIYHSVFNCLIMSDYRYAGFILPLLTYLPVLIVLRKGLKRKTESEKA